MNPGAALQPLARPASPLKSDGSPIVQIPRPANPEAPSVLLFALPKAGSVLLERLVAPMSRLAGLGWISVPGALFARGLRDTDPRPELARVFVPRGYCYGGFRRFPLGFDIPILDACRRIFLVRDPRDMLVSHYFSLLLSHPMPGAGSAAEGFERQRRRVAEIGIDEHVLEAARPYREMFAGYARVLDLPDTRLFRYEDVIFQKRRWVRDIADHFGWSIPDEDADAIADAQDILPEEERPSEHVRQVRPGNYRLKLRDATIARLNEIFADELERFGYRA